MAEKGARWNESTAVDAQVEALLQQLTLEHKIHILTHTDDANGGPESIPSLESRIPAFVPADGPAGVRIADQAVNEGKSTALPAPIALAATWDTGLARRYGEVLSAEAVATGHNVLFGPAVDIARVPVGGRTFESFGEDPLLQARMVAPEIRAIQAHPVQACIKHYIVNNQEYRRTTIDVRVDKRALYEIYLPPFAAAVGEGGVAGLMGAYNRINGTYACENRHTLSTLLKEELGFRGWVISDYMANPSTVESANAGLDCELGAKHWGPRLLEAVRAGQVDPATIDEMVRRLLRPMVGLRLFDQPIRIDPLAVHPHGKAARMIAEQGIVLLKNEGGLLPLSIHDLRSIAVIGPDADNVSAAGGGSGHVTPPYGVSVLEGIRLRVGDGVNVEYAPGVDPISVGVNLPGPPAVPSSVLTPTDASPIEHGLRAEYWANPRFAGEPDLIRTDPQVELNRGFFALVPGLDSSSPKLAPLPADLGDRISVRWTGSLTVPTSGEYTLSLTSLGSAQLYLDDRLLIDITRTVPETTLSSGQSTPDAMLWSGTGAQVCTATLGLIAGEPHTVRVDYAADLPEQGFAYGAQIRFGWQPLDDVVWPSITEAAALARRSDVAIVAVRTCETEAWDRPNLRLPNEQDRLIRAVAAANPRTIVVLMTGGPVETASWEDSVPAVLEAWYAGQEQGNAIARVLFGDVNPAGKLPLTFPHSEEQTPVAAEAQYPGIDGVVHYTEGIFVGYRGYDQFGIEPQYPFGYGLSYTTFSYSQLRLVPEATSGTRELIVSFTVTNTGRPAGTEIGQVYLGLPAAAAAPPRKLVGWVRVQLEPGESKQVTVALDPQSIEHPLSYWNAKIQEWEIAPGDYQVYVGASSRDIRLTGTFCIR